LPFVGAELIEFIDHLSYCRGSAIKYIFRAGKKDKAKEIEDLKKARWMINHEIEMLEPNGASFEELTISEERMP